jgi:hypothetical protein
LTANVYESMNAKTERQMNLLPWQQCVAFLLGCALLISRRPDAIFHAQFWAEDGHVWFANAFSLGWWPSLFRTQDGYFQTLPRLCASLALLVPLSLAPLVMNLIAIAVETLPINILLSSRSSAWGSLRCRALMAAFYLALPNIREVEGIITSSQWVLALCVFLLLVASPPDSALGKVLDASLILLCGLTGPFCVFLLPIAVFFAWRSRASWRWTTGSLLGALSLVQAWGLLVVDRSGRAHAALGASPSLFARILGGQVFLGTLLGANGLSSSTNPTVFRLLLCASIGGLAIVAICFTRSAKEMKLYILLSGALLAASFVSPAAYPPTGVTRWELLTQAGGIRYWFFPTLAFAWSLLFLFRSQRSLLKMVAAPMLLLMCFGIVRDWRIPSFTDMHWAENAQRVESLPAGTAIVFPENPQGWDIRLVKRREKR